MFWGITLESGKKYTQVLQRSFHVTMAALGIDQVKTEPLSVIVDINNAQYVLCTLQSGKLLQQPLDLNFTEGEEVSFFLEGEGEVHLTGYLLPNPTEYELDSEGSESEEDDDYDRAVQLLKKNFEKENKKSSKKDKVTEVSWQGKLAGNEQEDTIEQNEMEVECSKKIENVKEKNIENPGETEVLEAVKTQNEVITPSDSTSNDKDENNNRTGDTIADNQSELVEPASKTSEGTKKSEKKRKKEKQLSSANKNKAESSKSCDSENLNDEGETNNNKMDDKETLEETISDEAKKKRKNRKKNRIETDTLRPSSPPADNSDGVIKDGSTCTADENESLNSKQSGKMKKKRKQNDNKENPETENPKRKGKKRKE